MRDASSIATFLDQIFERIPMFAICGVQSKPFTPLNDGMNTKGFVWGTQYHFVGVWPKEVKRNFQVLTATSAELFARFMELGRDYKEDMLLRTPCGTSSQTSRGRGGLAIVHDGILIECTIGLNSSAWDEVFALLGLLFGLGSTITVSHVSGGMKLPITMHASIHADDFAKDVFRTILGTYDKSTDLTYLEVPSHVGIMKLNIKWQ